MSRMTWSSWLRRMDWGFLLALFCLMSVGVLFIYSASSRSDDMPIATMAERQVLWVAAGLAVFLGVVAADYRKAGEAAWGIYAVTLLLLIMVLVMGKKVYGAYRWLNVFGLNIQPSEIAKVGTMVVLARFLSDPDRNLRSPRCVLQVLAIIAVPAVLIMKQPDLGTAMTLVPVAVALMFVAGVPVRYLMVLGLLGLLSLPVGWEMMSDYQRERVLVFFDPGRDPLGSGWNKIQSEIAVGSGGWKGKGYLMGTQNVLGYLPRTVAPTDFIFSVIAEETGFVGCTTVLSLFGLLLWGSLRAALNARDKLGRLLATGAVTLVFFHVVVNMAMTVGLVPITGIPLPLISYGGSFMVCTLIALGLVQSVYVRRVRR